MPAALGSELIAERIAGRCPPRTVPTITRSCRGSFPGCQTSLVTIVISGTSGFACQCPTTARANSVSSETIRTLASFKCGIASFLRPNGGSGFELLGFFHKGEQSLGADPQIHGGFRILGALGLFDASVEIRHLVAREYERLGQSGLVSRAFAAIARHGEKRASNNGASQVL